MNSDTSRTLSVPLVSRMPTQSSLTTPPAGSAPRIATESSGKNKSHDGSVVPSGSGDDNALMVSSPEHIDAPPSEVVPPVHRRLGPNDDWQVARQDGVLLPASVPRVPGYAMAPVYTWLPLLPSSGL